MGDWNGGDWVELVPPHPTFRYAERHAVVMENILDELAYQSQASIVTCYGLSGSPLDKIEHVLADRVAQESLGFDQLSHVEQVLKLNVSTISRRSPQESGEILESALMQAQAMLAILVLSRFESLAAAQSTRPETYEELVGILARPKNKLPLLALFQQESEYSGKPHEMYPDLDISPVLAKSYPELQTMAVLRDYYRPGWEASGFHYSEDALATMFHLEKAIYNIKGQRRTFPYLATELIGQTLPVVQSALDGQFHLVKSLIYDARDALQELVANDGELRQLARLLDVIDEELQGILSNFVNDEFTGARNAVRYIQNNDDRAYLQRLVQNWKVAISAVLNAWREMKAAAENPEALFSGSPGAEFEISQLLVNAQFFGSHRYTLEPRLTLQRQLDSFGFGPYI